jgi:uncharacterized BrkB/YihY/UPF0761 family membrane protein
MERVAESEVVRLPVRVVRRFFDADGFSHSRAIAYQSMLVILPGFIGLIGLATVLDLAPVRGTVENFTQRIMPGPSDVLEQAADQGSGGGGVAVIGGLGSALLAATWAMALIERAANRMQGIDEDQGFIRRVISSFILALTAGIALAAGGLVLAGGRALARGLDWSGEAADLWAIARWPVGVGIVAVGLFLVFRFGPRDPPSAARPLLAGTLVGLVLWVTFTLLLALYFAITGDQASQTYGPLLTFVALLLWTQVSSVAICLGLATMAELEEDTGKAARKRADDVDASDVVEPLRSAGGS